MNTRASSYMSWRGSKKTDPVLARILAACLVAGLLSAGCVAIKRNESSWLTDESLSEKLRAALNRPVPHSHWKGESLSKVLYDILPVPMTTDWTNWNIAVSFQTTNTTARVALKSLYRKLNMDATPDPYGRMLFFGDVGHVRRAKELSQILKGVHDPTLDVPDSYCGGGHHINEWLSYIAESRTRYGRRIKTNEVIKIVSEVKDDDPRGKVSMFSVRETPEKSVLWVLVLSSDTSLVVTGNVVRVVPGKLKP